MADRQVQFRALDHVMLAYRLMGEDRLRGPLPPVWTDLLRLIDERVMRIDVEGLLAFAGPPRTVKSVDNSGPTETDHRRVR